MNAPFSKPLTDRELKWLRHIAVHGPQSSEFLLELCADTHSCRDTGKRALQRLREENWLRLPPQQRQIAKAEFNPHVYDLTPKARLHLKGLSDPETVRPTGHWWHAFLTASVTSAIAIEADRRGYRYVPAHDILGRSGATLAVPFGRQKLIPDQLFAIDYGGKFRSFALEVDRGTEPYASDTARKSLSRMIESYANLVVKDALRRHYGLKSPLLVLQLFVSPDRAARCLEIINASGGQLSPLVLVAVAVPGFLRYGTARDAVTKEWQRSGLGGLKLF